MTSEKLLREIAATAIREHLTDEPLNAIFEDVCCEQSIDPEHPDAERIRDLIHTWPILDLPVPDRDSRLWPLHGYVYGHVQRRGDRIIISRGDKPLHLTKGEALELASILTAAAMEEA